MVDDELLKSLAMAATPGPWEWWTSNSTLRLTGADGRDGGVLHGFAHRGYGDVSCSEANQAFIAAANPAAVLELIEENARLKAGRATPSPSIAPANGPLINEGTIGTAPTVEVDERDLRMLSHELSGVIADVESGHGFDSICLDTIKRVRAALASKPPPRKRGSGATEYCERSAFCRVAG